MQAHGILLLFLEMPHFSCKKVVKHYHLLTFQLQICLPAEQSCKTFPFCCCVDSVVQMEYTSNVKRLLQDSPVSGVTGPLK